MPAIIHLDGFAHLTDLPCVQLSFGTSSAVISLYGGQVLSYRVNDAEQLWLSPTTSWQQQQPIRGGIPICWPWFGPAATELRDQVTAGTAMPNHGLVRNRMWQHLADEYCADHSLLVLGITVTDVPWQQAPVQLQCRYQLDRRGLHIHLHADGIRQQQAALHSYFAVADVQTCVVTPLPEKCWDKVTGGQHNQPIDFSTETDRIYYGTEAQLTLLRPAPLPLSQRGHDASIVWNPGPVKGAAAGDIGPQQWHRFVCVETARLSLDDDKPLDLHLHIQG